MDPYLTAALLIVSALTVVLALRWSSTYYPDRKREAAEWREYQERMNAANQSHKDKD